jgi:hypothetical protein
MYDINSGVNTTATTSLLPVVMSHARGASMLGVG